MMCRRSVMQLVSKFQVYKTVKLVKTGSQLDESLFVECRGTLYGTYRCSRSNRRVMFAEFGISISETCYLVAVCELRR